MRRRRRIAADHDNHDRWLISYADFITLLFAFFVVMYAISAVNENKFRVLAGALGDAFGRSSAGDAPVPQLTSSALPPEVRQRTLKQQQAIEEQAHMTEVASSLMDVMGPLVKEGKVRVTQSRRGVSIEINANVLFEPGRAELDPGSAAAWRALTVRGGLVASTGRRCYTLRSRRVRSRGQAVPAQPPEWARSSTGRAADS